MPGPPPASTSKGSALSRGCPGPMRWQWPDRPVFILFSIFQKRRRVDLGGRRRQQDLTATLRCHATPL